MVIGTLLALPAPALADPSAASCTALEAFGIRDPRELDADQATFFQYQRWFCGKGFRDRKAAQAASSTLGLPSDLLDGVSDAAWGDFTAKLCSASAASSAFADPAMVAVVKTSSRSITALWSSCLAEEVFHGWIEPDASGTQFSLFVSSKDAIDVAISHSPPAKAPCKFPQSIPAAAQPSSTVCKHEAGATITVTLKSPSSGRTLVLKPPPPKPFACVNGQSTKAELRQLIENKKQVECLNALLTKCQDNPTVAECNRAQRYQNLKIAAEQVWMSKEQTTPRKDPFSGDTISLEQDREIALKQFEEALNRL